MSNYEYKQVLVIRKDLRMRVGKACAQAAHASLAATLHNINREEVKGWLAGRFTKIAVYVNSEEELLAIYNKALDNRLIAELILDAGYTEFGGVPTYTCIAVGPGLIADIDSVTKELPLL